MQTEEINDYKKVREMVQKDRRKIKKENASEKIKSIPYEDIGSEQIESVPSEDVESEDIPIEEINKLLEENNLQDQTADEIVEESDALPEDYYSKDNAWSVEERNSLTEYTARKILEPELTPEEQEALKKKELEGAFVEDYIKNHQIRDQAHMNFAIEHDEKFKTWLETAGRFDDIYTGKHIKEIEEKKEEVKKELEKASIKDKGNRVVKRFEKMKPEKRNISNEFKDAKKELDITAYKNKKLEQQGFILCMYLRKNGNGEVRYVKMDEVGQIKVDGYVYHERDAIYRFGKKNDPLLVIMEGALVPLNKETLKEHLGMESAEAQKLVIKGIEQAEVVKSGGIDDNANKSFAPPKWLIGVGIAIIIGIYAYMGGFT